MNSNLKNFTPTSSNLIDTTRDNINSNTFECLVSSERKNINNNKNNSNSKKSKKVQISDKVEYIEVECWKKYNYEMTAEENFDDFNDDEINKDDNEKNNNNNDKGKNKKKDNIVCTCILI